MAKFADSTDADYKLIASHLLQMAKEAPVKTTQRWSHYQMQEGTSTKYYVIKGYIVILQSACSSRPKAESHLRTTAPLKSEIHGARNLLGGTEGAVCAPGTPSKDSGSSIWDGRCREDADMLEVCRRECRTVSVIPSVI